MPLFNPVAKVTEQIAYTPTISGFGTVSNAVAWSQRVGNRLIGYVGFTTGTTAATEARIGLGFNGTADNVSIDTTKVSGNGIVGIAALGAPNAVNYVMLAPSSNQTYILIGQQSVSTAGLTPQTGNTLCGSSGVGFAFHFDVPIAGWTATN